MSEAMLAVMSFSFSHPTVAQEVTIGVAAAITLLGTKLCWSAPRYRMSMEERAKDGKITEEQSRRRARAMEWSGPVVVVIGVGLLAYGFMLS